MTPQRQQPWARPSAGGLRHTRPRIAIPPSGRQRHEEKITVYVSEDELLALEQTRLGCAPTTDSSADRGRIVREAIAVLLADFEGVRRVEHASAATQRPLNQCR